MLSGAVAPDRMLCPAPFGSARATARRSLRVTRGGRCAVVPVIIFCIILSGVKVLTYFYLLINDGKGGLFDVQRGVLLRLLEWKQTASTKLPSYCEKDSSSVC